MLRYCRIVRFKAVKVWALFRSGRAVNFRLPLIAGGDDVQSIIAQIYGGELCPSERSKISMAKFYEEKKIAVEAHNEFEDKLSESMKKNLTSISLKSFV